MLTEHGMTNKQVNQLMESIMKSELNEKLDMTGRWNDKTSDYPSAMISYLTGIIGHEAFNWLKENYPEAWCIPLFEAK